MSEKIPSKYPSAGRELDALVAEKVMGYRKEPIDPRQYQNLEYQRRVAEGRDFIWYPPGSEGGSMIPPPFSTDVATAWKVVEHSNAFFELFNNPFQKIYCAKFQFQDMDGNVVAAETMPHAVCLAALIALGVIKI